MIDQDLELHILSDCAIIVMVSTTLLEADAGRWVEARSTSLRLELLGVGLRTTLILLAQIGDML